MGVIMGLTKKVCRKIERILSFRLRLIKKAIHVCNNKFEILEMLRDGEFTINPSCVKGKITVE